MTYDAHETDFAIHGVWQTSRTHLRHDDLAQIGEASDRQSVRVAALPAERPRRLLAHRGI